MNKIDLNVKGMMCGGCENRVKRAVKDIAGVDDVTADFTTGKVSISCSNEVSKESIEKVIEDIGYEVGND